MPNDNTPTFHIFEKHLLNHVTYLTGHTVTQFEIIISYWPIIVFIAHFWFARDFSYATEKAYSIQYYIISVISK